MVDEANLSSYQLAKRSLLKGVNLEFIKGIIIYFIVYFLVSNSIQNNLKFIPFPSSNFFVIFLTAYAFICIPSYIYYSILIIAIRSSEEKSKIVLPDLSKILQKAWRLFLSCNIVFVFVLLGLICFIVPGLILLKRYIYVPIITEKEESLGLIDILRRSKALSEINGWVSLRAGMYLFAVSLIGIYLVGFTAMIFNPSFNADNIPWFAQLPLNLVSFTAYFSIAFFGYKDALNK